MLDTLDYILSQLVDNPPHLLWYSQLSLRLWGPRNRKYKDGNYPLPPKHTPHATPLDYPEQYLQFSKERDGIFRSVFNDKSYSIFDVTCDTSASYKEMNDIKVPLEDESSIKIRYRRLSL